MTIRLILTDDNITINEELKDNNTVYNYIMRVLDNFDDKDKVNINMVIKTDKQLIDIKIK